MNAAPEWIRTGNKVLCYSTGHNELGSIRITEIGKVATRSFMTAADGRFRIADRPQRSEGGTWGWLRCCIPLDSVEARDLLRRRELAQQRSAARNACEEYRRSPTKANRTAAIEALQAVEEEAEQRS